MLYLELLAGFALLLAGGDALVRGSVALATRLGVSPLLIGLTIVGFGTSAPELVTSLQAAFAGSPGIAVGNVVGSNIANVLLIVGVSATFAPIVVNRASLMRDGGVGLLGAMICVAAVLSGWIARPLGGLLVAGLIAYLVIAVMQERRAAARAVSEVGDKPAMTAGWATAALIGGIAGIVFGSSLMVDAAIDLARIWGVSEAVIGATIIAIGTSLPELATAVVAAYRGHPEIAFGNVLGSNIFNIFGILGVTALAHPIPAPPELAGFDVWVMLAAALALFVVGLTGRRVTRLEGGALLGCYAAYLGALLI